MEAGFFLSLFCFFVSKCYIPSAGIVWLRIEAQQIFVRRKHMSEIQESLLSNSTEKVNLFNHLGRRFAANLFRLVLQEAMLLRTK